MVVNTELHKLKKPDYSQIVHGDTEDLTEDMLTYLRCIGSKKDLIDLAEDCNMNVKGLNKRSIIVMLEVVIKSGQNCEKLLDKFVGKSGGFTLAMCTHGIVYGMKWLLAHESPRDFVDILVSMKYPPTICVADIPRRFVEHAQSRQKKAYFHPNEGMAAANTKENRESAINKGLVVEMP